MASHGGWIGPGSGSADYLNAAYWQDGIIDDRFTSSTSIASSLTCQLNTGRTTTGDMLFGYSSANSNTSINFAATGSWGWMGRTVTLGGDLYVNAAGSNLATVLFGTPADYYHVALALGGVRRVLDVAGNDVLRLYNEVVNGAVTKSGTGTLELYSGNNSFTDLNVQNGLVRLYAQGCLGSGTITVDTVALHFLSSAPMDVTQEIVVRGATDLRIPAVPCP